ncbi:hypothetical protein ABVZ50_002667 [Escherichia coli]|uniref:hypothetical protein n=1 Tax=Escherichia coli TaxID=562 RepID=UPI000F051569|nr:hypothetical protein [Escherichia coli]EKA6171108.1 hypothetical protein [Salmonella enterica]HBA3755168.1 hypothetical protein [Escherichia coli]HBA3836277.1 hypothetical protein [Escherichia coli]HBD0107796.1 hypothetical protein [Escherichia coli]
MTTFTDKELIKEIKERIGSLDVRDNVERRAYEIALASLESEPVASCIIEDGGMCVDGFGEYVGHSLPDGSHDLYTAPPSPVVPEGLVKAVRFYEQVKCENPPAETGAWKDAVDWVLKEACQAVNIGNKGE